ncbi:class I SAM-dependent methyltransferase [soil metagenome]
MDSQYFREYYTLERNHWWFTARSLILKDQISKIASGRKLKILNVGIATGSTTEMLSEFGEVTSVEYDKDCCDFLRMELQMEVTEASVTALPYNDESFDLVCAFDVIEHVEEDQLAIHELKRVCKKESHVFCTVPAFRFLWSKHDEVNHHIRRYTASQFGKLFHENGKIIFGSYFNTLLFLPVTVFRLISKILPSGFMRKGAGSDFTITGGNSFSPLLFKLLSSERYWLNKARSLPFGISYLLLWKK